MGFFRKPSLKRALGITKAKQKIARATGIPTTRAGRRQKVGRMMIGGGCRRQAAILLLALAATFWVGLILGCAGGGGGVAPSQPGASADAATNPAGAEAEIRHLVEERIRKNHEQHAEATAKYEAELKAYNVAEVTHATAVAKYDADLAALQGKLAKYEADLREYEKARREFDADARLQTARKMAKQLTDAAAEARAVGKRDQAAQLVEKALARYEEVAKTFPGTKAAADAETLRKGQEPAPRLLALQPVAPPKPAAPAKPVAPTRPTPPAPPPSAEDVLVAVRKERVEAAARATEEARAEAARKAEEEHDANGLVLLTKTVHGKSGQLGAEITGTVVNRRPRKLAYAQITFTLYDASGAQVDTAIANINGLEPGGRWNFKAVSFGGKFSRYQFSELSGF